MIIKLKQSSKLKLFIQTVHIAQTSLWVAEFNTAATDS